VIATLRNPVYLGLFREKSDFRIGHHEPIIRHELFVAAAAQLEARRTREPGKRYMIDWPSKGRIVCAVCDRLMSPHTIRYRNFIYRYYRCRSTAGGRRPCGRQVSAQAIEAAVVENVSARLSIRGTDAEIWKHVERVIYDHREADVRVSVIVPESGESGEPAFP
jgi:hypothetical protein